MPSLRGLKNTIKKIDQKLGTNIFQPKVVKQGQRPLMISVEVTSRCNLNCPFCLVGMQNSLPSTEHDLLPRGLGNMEFSLYEKIVADSVAFGIQTMQLHFQGEPLLHKQLPDMIRLAKEKGMKTQLFTNGLPLTPKMADLILKAGLDMMRFSVDGATQEIYGKNRVGGKFDKVHQNMKMMVEMTKERKAPIRLEWQMIGMRNNEHEIPMAEKMAADMGINFFVKSFAVTDPKAVPLNKKFQRKLHLKPCMDVYRAVFVYYTGQVVPCCYDLDGKAIVGDLTKQSLTEVWESATFRDLRHRIDNAYRRPDEEPALCKSCLKWGHEPFKTSDGQTIWSNLEAGEGELTAGDEDLV